MLFDHKEATWWQLGRPGVLEVENAYISDCNQYQLSVGQATVVGH